MHKCSVSVTIYIQIYMIFVTFTIVKVVCALLVQLILGDQIICYSDKCSKIFIRQYFTQQDNVFVRV